MGFLLNPVVETNVTSLQYYSHQAVPSTRWDVTHSCSWKFTRASQKHQVDVEEIGEIQELEGVREYLL